MSKSYYYRASDVEDIYDLCWSPDSKYILLGLTDNTAKIWDLTNSKMGMDCELCDTNDITG